MNWIDSMIELKKKKGIFFAIFCCCCCFFGKVVPYSLAIIIIIMIIGKKHASKIWTHQNRTSHSFIHLFIHSDHHLWRFKKIIILFDVKNSCALWSYLYSYEISISHVCVCVCVCWCLSISVFYQTY